ncbi:tectonin domain-containing protein [Mucilaginibacter sp. BT774]|uniref:tectonin domain-containing protein n=1 Tax=Mucilaginibacter sp. BT774 TaxID=3062276 RepID=UPI002675F0E1|nr:tectonin domain-containing protein [Mucilaginibacter sp. BT774]MDO3626792.1 Ig-like domain-containing protein [Mucilaginibacter sp. BT774]
MKKLLLLSMLFLSTGVLVSSCVKDVKTEPDHSVQITFDKATIAAGTTKQLVCKNYSGSDLIWTYSDSTVAAVNVTGMITAYKPGTTTINVKSKAYPVSATCVVTIVQANATDVGVGADGTVYVVGNDSVSATGGYGIYKWINGGLHKLPDCAAVRVAVSPQGVPWVVNKSNLIFRYNGTTWDQMPGTATDIGIGKDGSVFIIGTQFASVTGGNIIQKWNGSGWDTMPDCAGVHIAVDPTGTPWVVNKSNIVFQYGGTYLWNPIYGIDGNDIGIGADGSVFVTGKDSTLATYNPPVYKLEGGSTWTPVPSISGISISVDPNGKPWYIDKQDVLHFPAN